MKQLPHRHPLEADMVRNLKYDSQIVSQPIHDGEKLKKWIHDGVVVWENGGPGQWVVRRSSDLHFVDIENESIKLMDGRAVGLSSNEYMFTYWSTSQFYMSKDGQNWQAVDVGVTTGGAYGIVCVSNGFLVVSSQSAVSVVYCEVDRDLNITSTIDLSSTDFGFYIRSSIFRFVGRGNLTNFIISQDGAIGSIYSYIALDTSGNATTLPIPSAAVLFGTVASGTFSYIFYIENDGTSATFKYIYSATSTYWSNAFDICTVDSSLVVTNVNSFAVEMGDGSIFIVVPSAQGYVNYKIENRVLSGPFEFESDYIPLYAFLSGDEFFIPLKSGASKTGARELPFAIDSNSVTSSYIDGTATLSEDYIHFVTNGEQFGCFVKKDFSEGYII